MSPTFANTWFLPFFSNTACRGTCSAFSMGVPLMKTRADAPAFRCGSRFSNWNVTSNCREMIYVGSKKPPRLARAASDPTFALNV